MTDITKATRIINLLTDYSAIFIFWIVLTVCSGGILGAPIFLSFLLFLYYFLFEVSTGKTLGKMLTKTTVVSRNGSPASVFKIFQRSMLRFVPIDILSYLFGTELGFHDILSGTKLKKIA